MDKPASWSVLAKSRFCLHNVVCERARFDLFVSSLTKESVRLVQDFVKNPPLLQPYSFLKDKLLAAHQHTDYQRIAHRHKMGPLGARKPSKLLASMLEVCPRGHEARVQSGLCYYHWRWGDQATRWRLPACGETSAPGTVKCCHPWPAGAHHGPALQQALSCRYWG